MSNKVVEKLEEDVKVEASEVEASEVSKEVELTVDQALNVLVQAVRIAQKRGAYELEEAETVLKAIKVFTPKK